MTYLTTKPLKNDTATDFGPGAGYNFAGTKSKGVGLF